MRAFVYRSIPTGVPVCVFWVIGLLVLVNDYAWIWREWKMLVLDKNRIQGLVLGHI